MNDVPRSHKQAHSHQTSDRQVEKNYYSRPKYSTLERFISYFYQIDTLRKTGGKKVLLVGVGDGTVPYYLKNVLNLDVTTCDIDPELQPDEVCDIRSLSFADNTFDTVCAFEVLEHLPFEEAQGAYEELARVSNRHVVISVPHRRTGLEFVLKFPFIRTLTGSEQVRLALRLPVKFPGFATSKQHYWEIDWYTTRLSTVRKMFRRRCTIVREQTPLLDMYRRFFTLEKKSDD